MAWLTSKNTMLTPAPSKRQLRTTEILPHHLPIVVVSSVIVRLLSLLSKRLRRSSDPESSKMSYDLNIEPRSALSLLSATLLYIHLCCYMIINMSHVYTRVCIYSCWTPSGRMRCSNRAREARMRSVAGTIHTIPYIPVYPYILAYTYILHYTSILANTHNYDICIYLCILLHTQTDSDGGMGLNGWLRWEMGVRPDMR